jgi:beta-galactosidase
VVRFAARQAAILREANPRWEITHNALFSNVNGPDLVRQLDFFSHDHYPLFHNGDWVAAAVGLIQARSLSSPFCIMEHQSGPGGQMEYLHRTLEPGELKRLAFQSVAHGTRALLYFNWRTCPFGSEQHWYGLQDQDGRPTRRLREAEELGREIRSAAHVFEGQVPVKVAAVVKDFDSDNNDYRVDKYLQPRGQGGQFAAWLTRRHIPVDQVWSNGSNDWSDYRLLIVPNIQMVTPPLLARLEKYVAGGGTLVITARSGIKDGNGHMLTRPYPGSLAELAGVRVAEWTTLTQPVGIDLDGMAAKFTGYAETLEAVDSKVLARHDGSYSLLATAPAVTVREAGKARVIYVGGLIEERSTGVLLDAVLRIAGVEPTLAVPEDVELVEYEKHLVMINHTRSDQAIQVGTRRSVLGPAVVSGVLTLPGNGYAVVER